MKECDKWKSHISSEVHVIYISSNNVRHPVTKIFTTLHLTTLHSTCRHFTFSHLNFTQLHFTVSHLNFTQLHFTVSHLNFTQLHFTTLSFGLTPFKFPTAPVHLTSLCLTSLHFTFRRLSLQRRTSDWTQSSSLESSQIESWPGIFLNRRSVHSRDGNHSTLNISQNAFTKMFTSPLSLISRRLYVTCRTKVEMASLNKPGCVENNLVRSPPLNTWRGRKDTTCAQ